jgi:organic radical activating enzyme
VNAAPRSGFLPSRTIHLHPTRRCNLACLHCYSSSSPRETDTLPIDVIERALTILRGEGYETLSLSGGEPLLHPEIDRLTAAAVDLGYRVAMITNGALVGPATRAVLRRAHVVAVSFDGLEATHDRTRNKTGSFKRAVAALEWMRGEVARTALACTVSRESLRDVPAIAELAMEAGAAALQLRPLVLTGRATTELGGQTLDESMIERLYLIGLALRDECEGRLAVHTDLAPAGLLVADSGAHGALFAPDAERRRLADLVNPLVVLPDGALKPLTYDFARRFDLGNAARLDAAALAAAKRSRVPRLAALIEEVFAELARTDGLIDWFAYCCARGSASSAAMAAADSSATTSESVVGAKSA